MSIMNINLYNSTLPINNQFIEKNSNDLQKNNANPLDLKKNANPLDLKNNDNPLDLQKNFLTLLVTQIKNQDPTDPIKNSDLTSQLAQINAANGIERLNNTAIQVSNQINKNQTIQLSSLIGHHVMVPNDKIIHTKDTTTGFGVELFDNATSVTIKITDKNNKVLHLKQIQDAKAGRHTFLWDGKDLNKKSVVTGKYKISVTAKNKEENIIATSLSEAAVNSIIISSNGPVLDLGEAGKTIPSKIYEILK